LDLLTASFTITRNHNQSSAQPFFLGCRGLALFLIPCFSGLAIYRQSVSSWRQPPLRLTTSNFIFQLNIFGYSPYVVYSLKRDWVCHLLLLLVLPSTVILRSDVSSVGLRIIYYYLRLHNPPTWRARSRICIPQERGGPIIPPGTGFPFRCLLRLGGLPPISFSWRQPPLRLTTR
jgi:4-amino-4-deoxy-L-arabinose transferase-like glycosyltransferase